MFSTLRERPPEQELITFIRNDSFISDEVRRDENRILGNCISAASPDTVVVDDDVVAEDIVVVPRGGARNIRLGSFDDGRG